MVMMMVVMPVMMTVVTMMMAATITRCCLSAGVTGIASDSKLLFKLGLSAPFTDEYSEAQKHK